MCRDGLIHAELGIQLKLQKKKKEVQIFCDVTVYSWVRSSRRVEESWCLQLQVQEYKRRSFLELSDPTEEGTTIL